MSGPGRSARVRNYVRDASDVAASLVARCSGPGKFFAFTRALYAEQPNWQGKVEDVPQDQLNAIQNLPPEKEFFEIAKAAGLPQWAASRGLPAAKTTQCLTNEASIKRLIQITKDAKTQFPDFRGTPTFILNGSMVELGRVTEDEVWSALEAQIKAALGKRG